MYLNAINLKIQIRLNFFSEENRGPYKFTIFPLSSIYCEKQNIPALGRQDVMNRTKFRTDNKFNLARITANPLRRVTPHIPHYFKPITCGTLQINNYALQLVQTILTSFIGTEITAESLGVRRRLLIIDTTSTETQ